MSADPTAATTAPASAPKRRAQSTGPARAHRLSHQLDRLGLGFFVPFVRLATGDQPARQLREIARSVLLPATALALLLGTWWGAAGAIQMDSGAIPTPPMVWDAARGLHENWVDERQRRVEFIENREQRVAQFREAGREELAERFAASRYAGPPTFYSQILTSLKTVGFAFLIASLIAIPVGLLCGLSQSVNTALNPLIQLFRPVSPLAWLPIVFILVGGLYNPEEPLFEKAFLVSALTVTLCCLWPTLVNTTVGVASIDKDYLNVARVLKLGSWQRIVRIVLPASLPYIFTGLRLSLGVGWMVLIAADMLAQNPGLGKFIWDVFQNGSSESLSQIIVAVFAIGIIGFILDRLMFTLQKLVSFEPRTV